MECYVMLVLIGLLCVLGTVQTDEQVSSHLRRRRQTLPAVPLDTLTVTTILSPPYTMLKKNAASIVGNDKYEGYIPDLLQRLSQILAFNYTIRLVKDGRYGALQSDGSWNGMIGEVIRGEAMLAAAPITMTSMRHNHVDFVKPFQHLGLAFVMKKPTRSNEDSNLTAFSIFRPLPPEIWVTVAITYVLVALVMWGMNRFNPYEWGRRRDLGRATEDEGDAFNLLGSLWFAFVTLQWQGFERSPKSLGARVLFCFWFAFVTLFLVTYTASLACHLFFASTVHPSGSVKPPVTTFEELVAHGKINYGCVSSGSTHFLLGKTAKGAMYDRMRSYWENSKSSQFVRSTEAGLTKARSENYAFIMESTTARYVMNRKPCDLDISTEVLHPKSYGMVVSKNYKHLRQLNVAILQMRESGEIADLEKLWWEGKGECWEANVNDKVLTNKSSLEPGFPVRVNIQSFWGAIVLMSIGLVASIIVGVAEIMYFKFRGQFAVTNMPKDVQLQEETA